MAFGDYTNSGSGSGSSTGDSVTARLSLEMPPDMDQKLATVQKSVSELGTSMAAFSRFTKDAMDHLSQMPNIAKGMDALRSGTPSSGGDVPPTPDVASRPTGPMAPHTGGPSQSMPMPPALAPPGGPVIPNVPDLPAAQPHPIADTGHSGSPNAGIPSAPNMPPSGSGSDNAVIHAQNVTVLPSQMTTPSTALPSTVADAHAALVSSQAPAPQAGAQGAGTPNSGQPTVGGQALPDPGQAQGGRNSGGHSSNSILVGAAGFELGEHEKQQAQRAMQGAHQGGPSQQLQSLMDYRQKLEGQLGNSPARLLNRMHQEGMTTEGLDHGQATYGVNFGKTHMGVEDFMHNSGAQQSALDELARRTQPQSRENGSLPQQLLQGMNIANTMLGAMTPGADPTQTIGQIGQFLDSMVKSGHTHLQIPNSLGGIGHIFGNGGGTPATSTVAQDGSDQSDSGGGQGGGQFTQMAKNFAMNRFGDKASDKVKQTWKQFRSRGGAEQGADTASKASKATRGSAGSTAAAEEGGSVAAEGAEGAAAGGAEAAGAAGVAEAGGTAAAGGALAAGGVALAPVAAAAAAFVGIQKAGEKTQELYNMGTTQGGGLGAGMKAESSIQMMALNPFITSDQSRQIIMSALNEGVQGKQFDDMTSFMEHNLTTMNMSVADSTKLLQKNVVDGGESIETLGTQLTNLKQAAQAGGVSLSDSIAAFTKISGQGVDAGGGGQMSGKAAAQAGQMFAPTINGQKNPLAGFGSTLTSSAMASPEFQARLAQKYPGMMPQAALQQSIKDGTLDQNVVEQGMQVFSRVGNGPNSVSQAIPMLEQIYGTSISYEQAEELQKQWAGKTPQQVDAEGKKRTADSVGNVTTKKGAVGGAVSSTQGGLGALWHSFKDSLPWADPADKQKDLAQDYGNTGTFENPALNNITRQHGLGNTVVYDPQGKAHKVDYNDEAQMKGLQDGSWKIATTDDPDEQKTLAGDFNKGASEMQGSATDLTSLAESGGASNSGSDSGGTIGLTTAAAKLVTYLPNESVTNDTNTNNSNSGANGATRQDTGAAAGITAAR